MATNKTGGTAGKIENGDTLTFTYSEPITAASVWSGWNGASTAVNVRFTNGGNRHVTVLDADQRRRPSSSAASRRTATTSAPRTTFASTMVRSADGASIVVTLGTPANVRSAAVTGAEHELDAGAGINDLAGNTSTAATAYTETDSDVDF